MADLSTLPPPPAGYTVNAAPPAQQDFSNLPPPPAGYTVSGSQPARPGTTPVWNPQLKKFEYPGSVQTSLPPPSPGADQPLGKVATAATAPLRFMTEGMEQTGRGVERTAHPQSASDFAGGVSDLARGGMTLATPMAAPEMAAKPISSALGVGAGMMTGAIAEKLLKLVGTPEGYAELAGTAAGVGTGLGIGGLSRLVGKAVSTLSGLKSTLNPVEQNAVDFLKSRDVPLTAGTQTGNKAVQAYEATTKNAPLGAQQAAEFNQKTTDALQRVGGQLANETHPQPVTPESAGRGVGAALERKQTDLENSLSQQAHPQPVTPESAGRMPAAKMDKIIQLETLKRNEAYQQAWQGRYDPQYDEMVQVGTKDGGPVLDDEGKDTGFREQVPDMQKVNMPVDVTKLKEMGEPIRDQMSWRLAPAEQNASAGYNALNMLVKGPDQVPAWKAEDALGALKSMARLETGEGVRDVSQGIAAHLIPELQQGVDAAVAKTGDDALQGLQEGRRIHAGIMDVESVAKQLRDKEPVKNFQRLVAPNDSNLDFLRSVQELAPETMAPIGRAFLPEIFNRGRTAWQSLGPETRNALFPKKMQAGIENYLDVHDVAKQVSGKEPVDQFAKMVEPQDGNIDFVRGVQQLAPEQMPAVGAAWARQLVDKVTQEGGIGKTQGALNAWRNLGDQTKDVMFPDPKLQESWGNFFKGLDMVTKNPNTSGTELVRQATTGGPLAWLKGYLGGKLLYTPEGVDWLTRGLRSPGAASLAQARLRGSGGGPPAQPPTPPGGPSTPPATPPTSGAAALRGALDRNQAATAASKAKLTGGVKNFLTDETGTQNPGGQGRPDSGPHGPIFHEFSGKPTEAIAKLQQEEMGEVPRVWHNADLARATNTDGWIDLVWGNKGGGLAHVIAKHVLGQKDLNLADLAEQIPKMKVVSNDGRTVRLESATHEGGVRLDYDGVEKRWLVTAYEKPPTGGSPLVP